MTFEVRAKVGDDVVGVEADDRVVRIEAVIGGLAADGVAVGGNVESSTTILRPGAARSVERHHQQVEVDGQRVHRHDLDRQCPDEPGGRLGEQFVVGEPRPVGLEVAFDAEALPGGELGEQLTGGRPRLQTERVAGEVGDLGERATDGRRDVEQVTEPGIVGVALQGVLLVDHDRPRVGALPGRHVEPHRPLDVGGQRRDVGAGQQERRQIEQVGEHPGVLRRVVEIVGAGRTSGPHPATDHPPDHQGMAETPVRQPFVDVHQRGQ